MACLSLCALAQGEQEAVDPSLLEEGGFSMACRAGYGGYALPVANSALGRAWAQGTDYAWQAMRNQSILPVWVEITQRGASAFQGRLVVDCPDAYAPGEAADGSAGQMSREISVPPGVPMRFCFPVRACPRSEPGQAVAVQVSLFTGASTRALVSTEASALQLEPSHVYTLSIEPGTDSVIEDAINAGNHLELSFPGQAQDQELLFSGFGASTFNNYLLPCSRVDFCGMPLAARDFAFSCADAARISSWESKDQEALLAYVIGGGKLCLYNAVESPWEGLDLVTPGRSIAVTELGRGSLILCAGGLGAARAAMLQYLEGELQEFVVWAGGASGDAGSRLGSPQELSRRLRLQGLYLPLAGHQDAGGLPSRRPGYINPIFAYRELCRQSSLEPWDFPEFSLRESPSSRRTRPTVRPPEGVGVQAAEARSQYGLLSSLAKPRPTSPLLVSVGMLFVLALLIQLSSPSACTRKRRFRHVQAALRISFAAVGAGLLAVAIVSARMPETATFSLRLSDCVEGSAVMVHRDLVLRSAGHLQTVDLALPEGASMRRISGAPSGSWRWEIGKESSLSVRAEHFASAALDSWAVEADPGEPQHQRALVTRMQQGSHRLHLEIDTSHLDAGRPCWLLSSAGPVFFTAGAAPFIFEMDAANQAQLPGSRRIESLSQSLRAPSQGTTLFERLLAMPWDAAPGTVSESQTILGNLSDLEKLAVIASLRQPSGARGVLGQAPTLYYFGSTKSPATEVRLVRETIPLGGVE